MIEKFIKENRLSFKEGTRNTTVVTLVGYAQHIGVSKSGLLNSLSKQVEKDNFIKQEVNRLWSYCEGAGYKNYWTTKEASKKYKF